MDRDEQRMARREIINFALHEIEERIVLSALSPSTKLSFIKEFTRHYESMTYGEELQAYKGFIK